MRTIGGFYELLLPKKSFNYHKDAVALSTGRACIRVMLKNLKIKKCYLPNYTCDAVFHPFDLEKVPYELYTIDKNMEPVVLPELADDEYFFYINYFGVRNSVVKKLYSIYGNKLIIDNTHDFFKKQQYDCWSFTSARKYFGVPDGAFLYAPNKVKITAQRFNDYSLTHSIERLKGDQEVAFKHYQEYEKSLTCEINRISILSEKMLSLVNVEKTIATRKENFQLLDGILGDKNTFELKNVAESDMPFAYPFLPAQELPKDLLYKVNIFVPTLWDDPLKRTVTTPAEQRLAKSLMPLPIDERYDESDMKFMAEQIINAMEHSTV